MLTWFRRFVQESRKGKRLQKNGKRLSPETTDFYEVVLLNLERFSRKNNFSLVIDISHRRSVARNKQLLKYYKRFYYHFSRYLLNEQGNFDNYTGVVWKCIRTFFNWMKTDKMMPVGDFHQHFFSRQERVPLVTLVPERLQFLIYDAPFRGTLPPHLLRSLDMFLMGCATGLRFSDLSVLTRRQFEDVNGNVFLKNTSRKTETATVHKLPGFAVTIYQGAPVRKDGLLFTPISLNQFNKNLKGIAEMAGWTEDLPKYRTRHGRKEIIYRDPKKKRHYRFCDQMSSHCMRRTTITSLLCLGMSESGVRAISGHAAGSKDFYRYVNFARAYLDEEVQTAFAKLTPKHPKMI